MKVIVGTIVDFITKIKMEKNTMVEEIIFDFSEKGLYAGANVNNILLVNGKLNSAAFTDYQALGKLGVHKLNDLLSVIKTFSDEIEISVDGNLLILREGKRKVEMELMDVEHIPQAPELKTIEFDEVLKLSGDKLNSYIGNVASVNPEFSLEFKTEKGVLTIKNTGAYKFTDTFQCDEAKGGITSMAGEPFINAIRPFKKEMYLSIKANKLVQILEKTELSNISIIVAALTK